ncbi:VWFA domain-containing protein [Trichostrongylus colubriformis]|uniref:VWFA domain-containing protein n=1 Tax=Trichostrongylus colubriformis TaxID=6319 RepID=A0AAN8FMM5_TRICO
MMTFNRCTRLALLIHIALVVGVVVVNAIEEDNELLKICRPIDLRLHVLFLLDGSGSVSGSTFSMQMKVLDKIASMMNIGENKVKLRNKLVWHYSTVTTLLYSK